MAYLSKSDAIYKIGMFIFLNGEFEIRVLLFKIVIPADYANRFSPIYSVFPSVIINK